MTLPQSRTNKKKIRFILGEFIILFDKLSNVEVLFAVFMYFGSNLQA